MNATVQEFEKLIADFYGAPYAVATDCCTHAIELCLRYSKPKEVICPKHTYLSMPMTLKKLDIPFTFKDNFWEKYYYICNTNIIDAATYWQKDGYIDGTYMCLSFQFKKHLSTGRGGMILLDNLEAYNTLQCMKYDGRQNNIPWKEQNIKMLGFHYYMTQETAQLGIERFNQVFDKEPKIWSYRDYPDLTTMEVFH